MLPSYSFFVDYRVFEHIWSKSHGKQIIQVAFSSSSDSLISSRTISHLDGTSNSVFDTNSVLFFCIFLSGSLVDFLMILKLTPESNRLVSFLVLLADFNQIWQCSTFRFILSILFHIRIILLVIWKNRLD